MKTIKEAIQNKLENNKDYLIDLQIDERFLSRKIITTKTHKSDWENELGKNQSLISNTKEMIEFLEEYLKEL